MDKNYISKILGKEILSVNPISGGCIANSQRVIAEDGTTYFIKNYQIAGSSILKNEANGLKELKKANAVRVPEVIYFDNEYLVLEFIEGGRKRKDFFEYFGHLFALQHKYTAEKFGFFENNFIGSTEQKNLPQKENWREFYFENRLLFQFKLAERNGYISDEARKLFSGLENRLEEIIPDDGEKPALLHGDLWSGNYMCDSNGNPVLIDPAVYYGNREADLAMTKLFGGFDADFYNAYNETFPLCDDWKYREPIYKLYHVLNHANLFGWGYMNQALELMRFYL